MENKKILLSVAALVVLSAFAAGSLALYGAQSYGLFASAQKHDVFPEFRPEYKGAMPTESSTSSQEIEPGRNDEDSSDESGTTSGVSEGEAIVEATPVQAPISIRANAEEDDGTYFLRMVGDFSILSRLSPEILFDSRPNFDRDAVLADSQARIGADFHIPEAFKPRVGFWFDVYTKYSDRKHIIHHSRYPWVVFEVVDITPIIDSDVPKFTWMRHEKAEKHVKSEAMKIRAALHSLAKKRDLTKLTETEASVAKALSVLGGDVRKEARKAATDVRVQIGQRNFFLGGLRISPRYLGTMEKIFEKHKLPLELTRLPFVESSFADHAVSKVGAAGIWQFMGNTGKKFMLVDDTIDERRSPFKATEAAARLLKENHMILHRSWPLALTAWNHGPPGVRKAMKAAGTRELPMIVERYRSRNFDFASSNFYASFLAALHAERYNDIVFGRVDRVLARDLDVVKLPHRMRVSEVMKSSGLEQVDFLILNPDLKLALKRNLTLPQGFKVHVPLEARDAMARVFAEESALKGHRKQARVD